MATKTKKSKRIGNIICGVIIGIMVVCAILLFVARAQNRVTFIGGKSMIWILSGSMEPTIETNTYILIEQVTADEVCVGDVITFYSDDPTLEGNLNTHEVIEIIGDHEEFVTKGENNEIQDRYTAKADKVVGRYVKNLPALTTAMRFFMTKAGLACVLVAIALLTLALALPDLIRYGKEKNATETERLEAARRAEEERLIAEAVEEFKRQKQESDHKDE